MEENADRPKPSLPQLDSLADLSESNPNEELPEISNPSTDPEGSDVSADNPDPTSDRHPSMQETGVSADQNNSNAEEETPELQLQPHSSTQPLDTAAATPAREPTKREMLEKLASSRDTLLTEIRKVIVGQDKVVEELMMVLFSGGHCLISGAPGLAKTLLIRTLAQILDLDFKRVQFTPDLMPSDITGTEIIEEDRTSGHRELRFIKGPIFTNVLLADEINRTPPKTQAALLEAMEEKQVSVAGETHLLARPFYVFATQNPIELEGTYPLPEAQMDRFMFKILVDYLEEEDELKVATRTTSEPDKQVKKVFTGEEMVLFSGLVKMVAIADPIARYAVQIAQATRPHRDEAPDFVKKWVSWGAGTRASQNLILGAKARAIFKGRFHVSCEDIRAVAPPALRHRILTNFQADADRISAEDIIDKLLNFVSEPRSGL